MITPANQVQSHLHRTCEPPSIAKRSEVKTEGSEVRDRGKSEVEVEVEEQAKTAAAFASLTCHRKTTTELTAPTDQLKLGTEPQTARAPLPGERWPVLRRAQGDRSIDPLLWRAVARRDGWTCKICLTTQPSAGWEVDHIVPWSAGGEDVSTNLRLTCKPCNQRRSNYADPFARPQPPIVILCPDDQQTGMRAWCGYHQHWVHVTEAFIAEHELSARIARTRAAEFTSWFAGCLKEELEHLEAARTAAAAAKTAWDRRNSEEN